jgi:lysozyme
MAQVQYNEGVPDVAPRTSVPDDYQHIQANPDQFGGLIAKGEQQLGQGAQTAVKFYGEAVADNAANEYQERATKLLYGDPSKTTIGPDGQPQQDTGFFGLKGRAALDARPKLDEDFDGLTKELGGQLSSPEQQLQFDNFTRRFRSLTQSEVGRHADQQANAWYSEVNDKNARQQLNMISVNADKPLIVQHAIRDLIDARVKTAQLQGGGDELTNAAVAQGRQEGVAAWISATAAGGDYAKAQRMLDNPKNRADLGTVYDKLAEEVRAKAQAQTSDAAALGIFNHVNQGGGPTPHAAPVAGVPVSYLSAIQREEGFDPRPKWDVHQWTVGYGTRASGPNEQPSKAELDQRFAGEISKAAGTVDKINPNLDPGTKAALTSLTFNTGDAWTRSSLGQAVASGDIGAAQRLFLQYNHVAGVFSPAIAQRRNNEAQWFGNGEAPQQVSAQGAYAANKSSAFQIAMDDPQLRDNPALLNQTTTKLARMFADQEIADNQTAKQQKEAVDHAIGGYTTQMWDLMHSPNPDYVALAGKVNHDPALENSGPQKDALMSRIIRMSGEEQSLAFGPSYREAREALFSEPDAPGHLDSIVPLLNRDDITPAGLKDLQDRSNLAKKSGPDRMAQEKIINSFLADAQRQMVHDQDIGNVKIPDPKGAHLYNTEFVPRFMRQVSSLEAQADKSGNWDKLDQFLSRDNVDKMINEVYPVNQRNMDRISAEGDAGVGAQAIPPPPPGIKPEAWQSLMTVRPIAPDGQPVHPERWGQALQILQANPTPETIKAFDDHFGARGFDGQQILDKLGPAPASAAQSKDQPAVPAPVVAGAPAAAPVSPPMVATTNPAAAEERRRAIGAAPPPSETEVAQGQAEIDAYRAAHPPAVRAVAGGAASAHPASMTPQAHREIEREDSEKHKQTRLGELDAEEKDIKSRDFISREMRAQLDRIAAERAKLK